MCIDTKEPSDSQCALKAEPGKPGIKRRERGILCIIFNP